MRTKAGRSRRSYSISHTPESEGQAIYLPRPLFLFLFTAAVLTVASLGFSIAMRALHFGLPYSFAYFFVPGQMGSDFRLSIDKFSLYPSPAFYSGQSGYFGYPLPLFYLLRPIFAAGRPLFVFLGVLGGLTSVLVYAFARAMRSAGMAGATLALFVGSTVLLSYPLAFEYMRGNIEIALFAITAAGMIAWWRKKPMLAAFCFGIAGACKIYPLILVGLLFSERRWRAVLFAFSTAVAATLLAAWAFGPTIHDALAWDAFQLALFQKWNTVIPHQVGYDHSFLGLIKFFSLPWHPVLTAVVPIYVRTAAALSLLLYFLWIRHLPRLNQALILTVLSVTLPPVSYDYTLLAIYCPLILLSMEVVRRAQRGAEPMPFANRYFLLFGVILTPLSFIAWYSNPHHAQVRCLCLILIIWTALRNPITEMNEEYSRVTEQELALAG